MNNLQVFRYQQNEVRTVQQNNETWWVLKDVCNVLNLGSAHKVAERLDEDERNQIPVTDSLGRQQQTAIVNESGLYNVILRSDKPEAKQFKRWVTHDVLPTIRKTGGYVSDEAAFLNTYLPYAGEEVRQMFSATLQTIRSLNSKIESDKPKVLFSDAVAASKTSILIGDLAKIIRQNGVDIGQKRLFSWMRDNGFLMKTGSSHNIPTQHSMDRGLMEVKETVIANPDGSTRITRTPKVTGKGQTYFVNRFLGT